MQIAWNRINTMLLALVLLVLAGALARGVLGGPLDPPAPTAPTMKTLQQVEPRIPISQPASAAGFPIIISQPGSYYLTSNITGVAGQDGIYVASHDVTIDLNGFKLEGVPGSGSGINSGGWNTTVKNGSVSTWGTGIALSSSNWRVERVQARSNVGSGIAATWFEGGGTISDSIASNNGASGFYLARGVIRQSYAADNGASGISIIGPAVVEDNDVVLTGLTDTASRWAGTGGRCATTRSPATWAAASMSLANGIASKGTP